jgi:DNA-binding NarL/FixJ family response regulator
MKIFLVTRMRDFLTDARKYDAQAEALARAARELEQEVFRLRLEAKRTEDYAAECREYIYRPEYLRQLRRAIERGATEPEAIAEVASKNDLAPWLVSNWWNEALENSKSARTWRRNREIMRLAWAGKTNEQIARAVGMSKNSISRIIQDRLNNRERFTDRYIPGRPPQRSPRKEITHDEK